MEPRGAEGCGSEMKPTAATFPEDRFLQGGLQSKAVPVNRRYRLLAVASHPVPYAQPVCQLLAQHPKLDVLIAYCTASVGWDPQFQVNVKWDIPLMGGCPSVTLPNSSLRPGLNRFFGLINFGLWRLVRDGRYDAVVVLGYSYLSFWIAYLAAKSANVPVVLMSDVSQMRNFKGGWWWKRWLKPPVVRLIYKHFADVVAVTSTAGRNFMQSLGVAAQRIVLTPFVSDNQYFAERATLDCRRVSRESLGIPEDAFVFLFCGKLARWKRPGDLLRAFARVMNASPKVRGSAYLIFAGNGALRAQLERQAKALNVEHHVRFLGFVNQSRLPSMYAASDLLVLPSEHEAWGVVVNEAMACGLPVVVSDRVGAGLDLVTPGETGEIFPVGDIDALASVLRSFPLHRERTKRMGRMARERIRKWSCQENVEGWVAAAEKAVKIRSAG